AATGTPGTWRGDPWRGQASWFARLTQVLGAVAQSGSAPRSHREGQGFKSPQLHRVLPGQVACSIFWLPVGEPMWEPSRRIWVWLGLHAVATAKTASTSKQRDSDTKRRLDAAGRPIDQGRTAMFADSGV